MNYKDKKLVNFFEMELSFILMKSYYRRIVFCLASLFLVYYFYSLTAPSENHIITNDIIEQKPQSSLILDTIIKQDDSIDDLPIHTLVSPYKNGMFLYNMEEATESWWTFECIETKMKNIVNTQLCIHEPKYDHHISGQLKENGLWEPTNVRSFIKQLEEVPDANVIDIGANIGLYTLLAAKMKRYVIAVEPLHENLNRIHKASSIENVQSRITALVNAMSNKEEEVKVSILDFNIGGAYIRQAEVLNRTGNSANEQISSSVIVNSITMDDLLVVYEDKIKNQTEASGHGKFIIKIDIEGYEPYAFEQSRILFESLQIVAIFLEFGKTLENLEKINFAEKSTYLKRTKKMLKFFEELMYEPYEANGINKLEYKSWKNWPWDIYLRKCDLLNCPDHVYKATGA